MSASSNMDVTRLTAEESNFRAAMFDVLDASNNDESDEETERRWAFTAAVIARARVLKTIDLDQQSFDRR